MRSYLKIFGYLFVALWFSSARAGVYEDFFKAIEFNDDRTVARLIGLGFDVNTPSEQGQTGLFLALRAESYKAAQALLGAPDLKVDAANDKGETALMMAALRGSPEWSGRLLERGAAVDRPGWTPLHYAASGPSVPTVQLLIDRGAKLDASSPNGTTPLMMAAGYGPEGAVKALLAAGADPRTRNQLDLTAADFARRAGRVPLADLIAAAAAAAR